MKKSILTLITLTIATIILTGCASLSSSSAYSLTDADTTPLWQGNSTKVWKKLQQHSVKKLAEMQNNTNDTVKQAWIQLALLAREKSANTQQLIQGLRAWRERYPTHAGNQLFPSNATLNQLQATPPPQQIAVLLPQHGSYGALGKMAGEGFLNAYYANLRTVGKQKVKFYDTSQSQTITQLYQQALAEGADIIIGPLIKENVQTLHYTRRFSKPVLALNYTDNASPSANFYEFGLLPEDEANQIANRARKAGRMHAIVIAPDTTWGKRLVTAFTLPWQANGGSIQATWYYSGKENFNLDIARLLKIDPDADKKLMKQDNTKAALEQQRRHDFDVIFLFAQPQEARLIVPLLQYYYVNDIPIYATSSVYSGKANPTKDVDLNGVIVCDIPWNRPSQHLSDPSLPTDRLYAVGQDAYLLSQALTRLIQLPNFPIYGSTGALTLSKQQIHRRLPCIAIQNGLL